MTVLGKRLDKKSPRRPLCHNPPSQYFSQMFLLISPETDQAIIKECTELQKFHFIYKIEIRPTVHDLWDSHIYVNT